MQAFNGEALEKVPLRSRRFGVLRFGLLLYFFFSAESDERLIPRVWFGFSTFGWRCPL